MTITCDEFLEGVKRLITAPSNQRLLKDSDFLAMATSRMKSTLIPLINSVNEDYFVQKTSVPILQGVENYQIPPRAIGRKLREIKIFSDSGVRSDFPKISIEREHLYQSPSTPYGFHFYGDCVQLVPTPSSDGYSLQLWWFLSPGKLVTLSSAGLVTGVTGDDVTLASVPSTFTVGKAIDCVQGVTGNRYLGIDNPITGVAGNVISFAAGTVPSTLALGDYLSLAGQSPVLQVPEEASPYLEAITAYDALYAISDFEGQKALSPTIKEHKANLLSLLAPRISGEPNIIINDRSLLRGRSSRRNLGALWRM